MYKSLFLVTFALILFGSCSEGPTITNNVESRIWPLSIGNYWKYQVANIQGDSLLGLDTIELRVWDKVRFLCEECYFLGGENHKNKVYFNKADGLWIDEYTDGQTMHTPDMHLYLKFPTKAGDIVTWKDETVETKELNVPVNVPAGNYKAIHYIERLNRENHLYLVPGIGLIRQKGITMITPNENDTVWIDLKLIEYNVKRK